MLGMIGVVIAFFLIALATVLYFSGICSEKSWGKPSSTVLVLSGVVIALISVSMLFSPRFEGYDYPLIEELGALLAPELQRGANVLFLVSNPGEGIFERYPNMEQRGLPMDYPVSTLEEWKKMRAKDFERALERGSGASITVVGSEEMLSGIDVRYFNAVLDVYEPYDVDLIVSLYGKPQRDEIIYQLDEFSYHNWNRLPMFAVVDGLACNGVYNPSMLREAIENGQLAAVRVLTEEGAEPIFITRDNLHELPDRAPQGPYSE